MATLELKIPPPLVALACAALAWAIALAVPAPLLPGGLRIWLALALGLVGLGLGVSGLLAFRRAKTTISPHAPDATRAIVRTGPYRFTRNPMYLGLACMSTGFCAWLGNPAALLAVVAFLVYLTLFQIIPEERILSANFGDPYREYLRAVRRWL